jgi:hypothetical protein
MCHEHENAVVFDRRTEHRQQAARIAAAQDARMHFAMRIRIGAARMLRCGASRRAFPLC